MILLFNLIPIIPLDGSKIVNLILNKIFSFKLSDKIVNIISVLLLVCFLILNKFNLIGLMVLFLLSIKVFENIKNHKYLFNKFLFERYIYNIRFKKNKIINGHNLNKMKRDYKHLFLIDKTYQTEKEILNEKFDI